MLSNIDICCILHKLQGIAGRKSVMPIGNYGFYYLAKAKLTAEITSLGKACEISFCIIADNFLPEMKGFAPMDV